MENISAAASPAELAHKIYTAAQEVVPTAFLQWHWSAVGRGMQIVLLHLVSSYTRHMGMLAPTWDDLYFVSNVKVTRGAVVCTNWLTSRLHQIGATVHVLRAQVIDAALASDLKLDLMGPFTMDDADMDAIHFRNTIYLPAPFLGIFLERDLTPFKVLSRLRGSIFNAGATVYCQHIIDWLQVALAGKSREDQPYPLSMR